MTREVASEKIYESPPNKELLALVQDNPDLALDVGCGSGANASELGALGWVVDGLTASEKEASRTNRIFRSVQCCNLEDGLPSGLDSRYKAILLSHVLEHIAYPERLLGDLHDILSTEGKIYVALPNIMNYKCRLRLLLGRFDYEEHGVWDYTHLRWYTFRSGRRLLEDHGYVVEYAGASGGLPFGRASSLILGARLSGRMANFVCNALPGLLGGQLLYVARLPSEASATVDRD